MDEHPAAAVRAKKDSSIVVGARLVKEGVVDGFFSRGQHRRDDRRGDARHRAHQGRRATRDRDGAARRPRAATTILLDVGRQRRREAGVPGAVRAHGSGLRDRRARRRRAAASGCCPSARSRRRATSSPSRPTSSWRRRCPGSSATSRATTSPAGVVDVVVTDGFTGNVALKLMEGLAAQIFGQLRTVMTADAVTKLAAGVLKPQARGAARPARPRRDRRRAAAGRGRRHPHRPRQVRGARRGQRACAWVRRRSAAGSWSGSSDAVGADDRRDGVRRGDVSRARRPCAGATSATLLRTFAAPGRGDRIRETRDTCPTQTSSA